MVHTKTYLVPDMSLPMFTERYLVLFTMVPRNGS